MTKGEMLDALYSTIDYLRDIRDEQIDMTNPLEKRVCTNIIRTLIRMSEDIQKKEFYEITSYEVEVDGQINMDDIFNTGG